MSHTYVNIFILYMSICTRFYIVTCKYICTFCFIVYYDVFFPRCFADIFSVYYKYVLHAGIQDDNCVYMTQNYKNNAILNLCKRESAYIKFLRSTSAIK